MPELSFFIDDAAPVPYAAVPQLAFKLRVVQTPGEAQKDVQSVMLRCQIRIEPGQRRYRPAEQERLRELFGEPQRWGQTVRSMLWTNEQLNIGPFREQTSVDLVVPCTFDFNIATTKYLDALEGGEIPLCLLFSGTIFYSDRNEREGDGDGNSGTLQVDQISWQKEASFRLPASTWRQMMQIYYPNCAWLTLTKDTFDRLSEFKLRTGLPSVEAAIDRLLAASETRADT